MIRTVIVILFALFVVSANDGPCSYRGISLHGRVRVVDHGADLRVKVVKSQADIRVQVVKSQPLRCGQWQWVDSQPDFTIQYVESQPDITIQFVNSQPDITIQFVNSQPGH